MDTNKTPAERVRELAALMQTIQSSQGSLGYLSAVEDRYGSTASEKELADAEADRANLRRERDEAQPAFDALVAQIRVETPTEIAVWAEALAAVDGRVGVALAEALLGNPKVAAAAVVPALENGLTDCDVSWRWRAWDGLVKVFGLADRGPKNGRTELDLSRVLLSREYKSIQEMAAADIRRWINQLQAGATPESLGILRVSDPASKVFKNLGLAKYDASAEFPVDEISRLTGVNRRWAEMLIVSCLENPFSEEGPRVPEALARLGARWTAPALEEVLQRKDLPAERREQIMRCLSVLNG